MTNKGKVLAVVIVAAMVLAGGASFYFKGGDLVGRMTLKVKDTKSVSSSLDCPSSPVDLYWQTQYSKGGQYSEFKDFFDSVWDTLQANDGKMCPYRVYLHSDVIDQYKFICSTDEVDGAVGGDIYGDYQFECFNNLGGGQKADLYLYENAEEGVMALVNIIWADGSSVHTVHTKEFEVEQVNKNYL